MMLPLVIAVMPEGADRDYMEWLFVEHHRLMMVTAFGIVPQSADADEIVSDSLIALYKKIDKLRGMEKNTLRLYIVSTVRNTSLNYLKKHQRMNSQFLHMPDAVICQIPGRDNTEGKIVLSEGTGSGCAWPSANCPSARCMAIQLKFDLDRTDAEIAQLMGISVDSVRRYIHRGQERIRQKGLSGGRRTMNENRLNFPEIQDAHLDQMIRLAFAQEAALLAQEWMAQSETPETPPRNRSGQSGFEADVGAD